MICTKCQNQNEDVADFCVYCGAPLPKEARISATQMADGRDDHDRRKKEAVREARPEPGKDRPEAVTELEPREETEVARLGAVWDYKHVFIQGATARESGEGVSRASMPMVGRYEPSDIQRRLQELGGQGWELVCMEPQWFWERVGVSMAAEITRPRVIAGWYCTFKRKLSVI